MKIYNDPPTKLLPSVTILICFKQWKKLPYTFKWQDTDVMRLTTPLPAHSSKMLGLLLIL